MSAAADGRAMRRFAYVLEGSDDTFWRVSIPIDQRWLSVERRAEPVARL